MIISGPVTVVNGVEIETRSWEHFDDSGKACIMLECLHAGRRVCMGKYYSDAGRDTWLQIASRMVGNKQTERDTA